jgi:hypothetical protein
MRAALVTLLLLPVLLAASLAAVSGQGDTVFIRHTPIEDAKVNELVNLSVQVVGTNDVARVTAWVRGVTETDFTAYEMVRVADTNRFFLTYRVGLTTGTVAYYFEAIDGAGTVLAVAPAGYPEPGPYEFRVREIAPPIVVVAFLPVVVALAYLLWRFHRKARAAVRENRSRSRRPGGNGE